MLEWSCQERDYGYAFYAHLVRPAHATADNARYLWFKIQYRTANQQSALSVYFNDHWHSTRTITFEFAKLTEAWDFVTIILKHLRANPHEYLQIGVFS